MPIPDYKSSRTGEKAVAKIERSEPSLQRSKQWQAMQNQAIRTLNQMASAKGLPSYEQFHRENGVVYKIPPGQGLLGIECFIPANRQFHGLILEDNRQIAQNLSYAQRPLTLSDQLRNRQIEMAAEQAEHARQAAMQNQRQQQWARQKANELRRQVQPKPQKPVLDTPVMQIHATKSRENALAEQAFRDPNSPERNIIEQANGSQRLPESKLRQARLNLDTMLIQGKISIPEYQELAAAAKLLTARNWLRNDGKDSGDGVITYRSVKMAQKVASKVAYADAKRYWDKEVHLSAQELGKAALAIGKGVYDFFIGDDIRTLQDPHATLFQKVVAGGSIAMVFGGGFVEKAGLRAMEKLGGKLLIRVSGKSEQVLAKLAEKGLNPEQIRNYKRFVSDKAKIKDIDIYHFPGGGKAFEGIKAADNAHNSHTVWQKFIDADGKTIIYGHRTEYKNGKLIHWHEDFSNKRFEIKLSGTNGEPYLKHLRKFLDDSKKGK